MSLHHSSDAECPLCEFKLSQAHGRLAEWYRQVKAKYPNVHVSWSYRGPEDQDKAFFDGKSTLRYPDSKHNKMQDQKPCAEALDLFQIDEDGVARFSPAFYAKVAEEFKGMRWGGTFRSLEDKDHFEIEVVA